MSEQELILNYHDACLYKSDLAILTSPYSWLNDSCIHFRLTQLHHQVRNGHKDKDLSQHKNRDDLACMMDPSVLSYIVHQCDDDDLKDLYHSLSLHEKQFLFVPINDGMNVSTNTWRQPGGGSHYSMLFVSKIPIQSLHPHERAFFHFDSSGSSNLNVAKMVSERLWKLFHMNDVENVKKPSTISFFRHCRTPQQRNNYDCGLYSLKVVESLITSAEVMSFHPLNSIDDYQRLCENTIENSMPSTHNFAKELRTKMAEDVQILSKEYLANKI